MSEAIAYLDKDTFDSVTFYEEDNDKLQELIKKYLENPKHLVINLSMINNISEEFLDYLNFLSTILKSENYSVQVFSPPASVGEKLGTHRYRNIPEIPDLAHYIMRLVSIEKELRVQSLLKSYVDETMKHIFAQSTQIIKRGELTIEEGGDNFHQKMNYFQTFELENGFFSFVIAAEEQFFSDFLETLKEKALGPIFNSIISRVPSQLLENVKVHEYLSHPYDNFPSEKIEIKGEAHHYFENSSVMVIPLECNVGTFNLEVWIPKQFAVPVYNFLNP